MKNEKLVCYRNLDELGRVTIPIELGIRKHSPNQEFEAYVEDGKIYIIKEKTGRKLDELGRYTLPMDLRKELGFKDRQKVAIFKVNEECICVQNTDETITINLTRLSEDEKNIIKDIAGKKK